MTINATVTSTGNTAQACGNDSDDSTYVVFGYGSLIFRVRKSKEQHLSDDG